MVFLVFLVLIVVLLLFFVYCVYFYLCLILFLWFLFFCFCSCPAHSRLILVSLHRCSLFWFVSLLSLYSPWFAFCTGCVQITTSSLLLLFVNKSVYPHEDSSSLICVHPGFPTVQPKTMTETQAGTLSKNTYYQKMDAHYQRLSDCLRSQIKL